MVFYDITDFYNITVIVIMLMDYIIFINDIMAVFNDMLMFVDLTVGFAGKALSIYMLASPFTKSIVSFMAFIMVFMTLAPIVSFTTPIVSAATHLVPPFLIRFRYKLPSIAIEYA